MQHPLFTYSGTYMTCSIWLCGSCLHELKVQFLFFLQFGILSNLVPKQLFRSPSRDHVDSGQTNHRASPTSAQISWLYFQTLVCADLIRVSRIKTYLINSSREIHNAQHLTCSRTHLAYEAGFEPLPRPKPYPLSHEATEPVWTTGAFTDRNSKCRHILNRFMLFF